VDHAQVVALQHQGQPAEQPQRRLPRLGGGEDLRHGPAGGVQRLGLAEEPGVAVLPLALQEVQLVVAQDALGQPPADQPRHQPDDGRAVGAAVGQVAEEHQAAPFGVGAAAVAELAEQGAEGVDLAVDVGHHVHRPVEQGLDEGVADHGQRFFRFPRRELFTTTATPRPAAAGLHAGGGIFLV
jgi:hypothetical protein